MIRKALLVLMVLVLMCPALAQGDNHHFSFRNDIRFGDSIEEVKEKEEANPKQENNGSLYYGDMLLSTIGNSAINYNFTDGKLVRIIVDYNQNYSGSGNDDTKKRAKEYNKINDGLIRKYGEPEVTDEKNAVLYPFGGYYWYKDYYENRSFSEQKLISINQWTLYDGDNNIVIEHVLFEVQSSDWGYSQYCVHMLTYQLNNEENDRSLEEAVDNDL